VRAKKLGPNFEHFGLVVWPQVANKCWKHWPQGLQIGFPNSMVSFSFFFSFGTNIQGYKVQPLFLVTCVQIEKIFFLFQA
jgi:hypothetical protein